MNLRKELAAGAAALALIGSVMNVSAAELSSRNYVDTLIKNNQVSLILDVDAYKAAYADLAKAYGNNTAAYVNHYLTTGVFEGRTKGVLFDPLLYAEAYSDVKNSFGYDISAIVDHYIQFGIAEDRIQGTAQGYADIAAAEAAGVQNTNIQRDIQAANNSSDSTGSRKEKNTNDGKNNVPVGNAADGSSDSKDSGSNTPADNSSDSTPANYAPADTSSSSSAPASSGNSSAPQSNSAPSGNDSASQSNSAPSGTDNSAASNIGDYHHTTSIYDNDEQTLLRVEYYDEYGKLINYSSVTDFDTTTNSYKENIYHYDYETQTSILDRTDTYVNGSLSSSENH